MSANAIEIGDLVTNGGHTDASVIALHDGFAWVKKTSSGAYKGQLLTFAVKDLAVKSKAAPIPTAFKEADTIPETLMDGGEVL